MLKESLTEKSGAIKLSPPVPEVATGFEQQISEVLFGSCGVELTVHNGKITRVSR